MILQIIPTFIEHKWGEKNLAKIFPEFKKIPRDKPIGEIILVSGASEHANKIKDLDETLNAFYIEKKDKYFNNYYAKSFPISIKIVYTHQDLKPIVFPNDKKARKILRYPTGRAEIWYILESDKKDRTLILGNNAKSKKHLHALIKEENWDLLFKTVSVESNQSYNVDSGTINKITAENVILKIANNSDIFLWFPKQKQEKEFILDQNTNKLLKIIKWKNDIIQNSIPIIEEQALKVTLMNFNHFMNFEKWQINGKAKLRFNKLKRNFLVIVCFEGNGIIGSKKIAKWDCFVLTSDELNNLFLEGKMLLFVIYPNSKNTSVV